MVIGHLAVSYAVKSWKPQIKLMHLVIATMFIDLVESVFVMFKIAVPYFWSLHFLPGATLLSLLYALIYFLFERDKKGTAIIFLVGMSHLLLDYVSSRMELWQNGPEFGLALCENQMLLMFVEFIMFSLCAFYYYMKQVHGKEGKVENVFFGIFIYYIGIQALKSFVFA